jgi:hypothetical protein
MADLRAAGDTGHQLSQQRVFGVLIGLATVRPTGSVALRDS